MMQIYWVALKMSGAMWYPLTDNLCELPGVNDGRLEAVRVTCL